MSENKWTPGPWRAVLEGRQPQPMYWGLIASVECSPDGYKAIVTEPPREVPPEEWEANSRLIAAAPEMAEKWERLAEDIRLERTIDLGLLERDIRALLAKIRGTT